MDEQPDTQSDSAQRLRSLESETQSSETAVQNPESLAEALDISESIVTIATQLRPIDTLEEIPREESIEEARKILRWFRNMEFTDRSMEEFLDSGTLEVINAKKKAANKLAQIFAAHLQHVQRLNRDIARNNAAVEHARDAVL